MGGEWVAYVNRGAYPRGMSCITTVRFYAKEAYALLIIPIKFRKRTVINLFYLDTFMRMGEKQKTRQEVWDLANGILVVSFIIFFCGHRREKLIRIGKSTNRPSFNFKLGKFSIKYWHNFFFFFLSHVTSDSTNQTLKKAS